MEGGTAKVYHCNDSDKCLKVVADANVTIARDKALKSQITKLLTSIQNKAVSDTPLDDREKGFISSTTVPVFKYLIDPQMLGVSSSVVYQLTDYIGYDIMLQYIQELLQQARAMIATGELSTDRAGQCAGESESGTATDCGFPGAGKGPAGCIAGC